MTAAYGCGTFRFAGMVFRIPDELDNLSLNEMLKKAKETSDAGKKPKTSDPVKKEELLDYEESRRPNPNHREHEEKPPRGGDKPELTQEEIDRILAIPKGKRPDPSTYLSREYIDRHLAQFDDGVSIIMTRQNYEKFVFGNDYIGIRSDGTQFVMPKSVCDELTIEANGDINAYETALGFDVGHFSNGGGLIRIDVMDVSDLNLRMPSGNEYGANEHWIPGGYTDCGVPEAVSDLIPNLPSRVIITKID